MVGSGISGGWAAKELCEKRSEKLVLEGGRNINPNTDFAETGKAPWELAHRGRISARDKIKAPYKTGYILLQKLANNFS